MRSLVLALLVFAPFLAGVAACDAGEGASAPANTEKGGGSATSPEQKPAATKGESASGSGSGTPDASCPAVHAQRVSLMTEDSVELIADHDSPGIPGAPSVVLLHMIPPHHSLDNYPRSFIDALVAAGFEVINVNRRGAPGSKGIPEQAYQGDKGKLDALAGVRFLLDAPCKPNAAKIAMIGASNGTTSMVDYAVHAHAAKDPRTPPLAAMIFLSGGGYSEAQHELNEQLDTLGPTPALFAYPAKEAEWNTQTESLAKDAGLAQWSFHAYEPGAHGSKLFKTNPSISEQLVSWLSAR